jgi:hypothetical protein
MSTVPDGFLDWIIPKALNNIGICLHSLQPTAFKLLKFRSSVLVQLGACRVR